MSIYREQLIKVPQKNLGVQNTTLTHPIGYRLVLREETINLTVLTTCVYTRG